MNIIAFALVVFFTEEGQIISYWLNQKHCLSDARVLSTRTENYQAVKAYCKPVVVNPEEVAVRGYSKNDDR